MVAASSTAAFAQATPIVRWDMTPTSPDGSGNPKTLDRRTAPGQGTEFGGALDPAAADHLFFFGGFEDTFVTSGDVPPASMFNSGFDAGEHSYDAAASVLPTDPGGILFFPQDVYGNELAFFDAFTVEMFFKTVGDQSQGGVQQLILQAEGFFRYAVVLNESAEGGLRFAINDGVGTIFVTDLTDRNFADGQWWYLLGTYDPAAGENGQLALTAVSESGAVSTAVGDLPEAWAGLPRDDNAPNGMSNDGNMVIGAENFGLDPEGDGPRRFVGLLDEIQLSQGILPEAQRLGVVPDVVECQADRTGEGTVNVQDLLDYLNDFRSADPTADLTGEGTVNVQDLLAYLNAFRAGC